MVHCKLKQQCTPNNKDTVILTSGSFSFSSFFSIVKFDADILRCEKIQYYRLKKHFSGFIYLRTVQVQCPSSPAV